jgi:hypothetical protein
MIDKLKSMLIWTYRIIKHLLIYLVVLTPLEIIGLIILFPVLLFVSKDSYSLPKYLAWFDNDTLDGINGSYSFRKDMKTRAEDDPSFLRLAYARYVWIALRNPLNSFQYQKLGIPLMLQIGPTRHLGDTNVGDMDYCGTEITEVDIFDTKVRTYWELYTIIPYRVPFYKQPLCIRIRLGWKLTSIRGIAQFALVFNPVMPFRGTCTHLNIIDGEFKD